MSTPEYRQLKKQFLAVSMFIQGAIAVGDERAAQAWRVAADALQYAHDFHQGMRKDGCTPEYSHQLEIVLSLLPLVPLMGPVLGARVVAAACLHDVREDYDVEDVVLRERFGAEIADAVECLTKKFKGVHKDAAVYFAAIADNLIAAIVKGGDRTHNVRTMLRVFSLEKQRAYAKEVRDHFLPMLKDARKRFAGYRQIFEVLKDRLQSLVEAVEVRLDVDADARCV